MSIRPDSSIASLPGRSASFKDQNALEYGTIELINSTIRSGGGSRTYLLWFSPSQHSIAHPGLNFNRWIEWPRYKSNYSAASAISSAAVSTAFPPKAATPDGSTCDQKIIG